MPPQQTDHRDFLQKRLPYTLLIPAPAACPFSLEGVDNVVLGVRVIGALQCLRVDPGVVDAEQVGASSKGGFEGRQGPAMAGKGLTRGLRLLRRHALRSPPC